jgi:hypothetical protein
MIPLYVRNTVFEKNGNNNTENNEDNIIDHQNSSKVKDQSFFDLSKNRSYSHFIGFFFLFYVDFVFV